MKIRPRDWARFQHYKNRKPPWIKLHRGLLDDAEYHRLQDDSKAIAPLLWLLASESDLAEVDLDFETIAWRLRSTEAKVEKAIKPLIEKGFFILCKHDDSATQALCKSDAIPEVEREEELEKKKQWASSSKRPHKTEALKLLQFLNTKCDRHFRPVDSNLRFIEARLAEGIDPQDLRTMTIRKWREWSPDPTMHHFIRPETLFNATKCHQYLGEFTPCNQRESAQSATSPSAPASTAAPAAGQPRELDLQPPPHHLEIPIPTSAPGPTSAHAASSSDPHPMAPSAAARGTARPTPELPMPHAAQRSSTNPTHIHAAHDQPQGSANPAKLDDFEELP